MRKSDMERRMYKRVSVAVKLRFLVPLETFERVYEASTFDVGKGGIGLVSDQPLKDGTAMIVELDPGRAGVEGELIRIQAQCIWCEAKGGQHHMGVMFYYFDEGLRERVGKFVDSLESPAPIGT